jgi:hypothetical protein
MKETICLFGCYLGEAIIRNHGGVWKVAAETGFKSIVPADLLVLETPNKAVWNPIGKAFKLLENGMEDSLAFFYGVATSSICKRQQIDSTHRSPIPLRAGLRAGSAGPCLVARRPTEPSRKTVVFWCVSGASNRVARGVAEAWAPRIN